MIPERKEYIIKRLLRLNSKVANINAAITAGHSGGQTYTPNMIAQLKRDLASNQQAIKRWNRILAQS